MQTYLKNVKCGTKLKDIHASFCRTNMLSCLFDGCRNDDAATSNSRKIDKQLKREKKQLKRQVSKTGLVLLIAIIATIILQIIFR